jgi:uncharacterized protein
MAIQFTKQDGGVALAVKVVPGASRDRIAGEYGGGLKITVSAPAEGGAANRAVVKLLAASLGVPQGNVQITRGQSSPRKQVCISGIALPEIQSRLAAAWADQ